MEKKKFHCGDILSIITGRLLSPRRMHGVMDLLHFMTGDNGYGRDIPGASEICANHLLRQFPQLSSYEIEIALLELNKTLMSTPSHSEKKDIVVRWLEKQIKIYGAIFLVSQIPEDEWVEENHKRMIAKKK
ncbi:MAG: hypothetical protein A3A04_01570 [Candidatus Harrisonbacteria bacterium RIFCSPLOWO2_01_FULL_40_28]|uniref:DUF7736 domain-containing protein n=2 Tax=Candidatus Harrisoniibacteriota TaxID=1817905 RepID=A0A1G1ZX60_9BACT|nr:MAG: hypothetical protein A3A04_01570 [Candidatus Harrisonbacteria bacterium RIFCSPLOWO2_01_FULL_40_28]OGY69223.1 MAG: hypothetical protein A2586_01240 [Candidatus Harrisonbacteria bacterium RIFOXYD1_FULL_40_9]